MTFPRALRRTDMTREQIATAFEKHFPSARAYRDSDTLTGYCGEVWPLAFIAFSAGLRQRR